VSSFLVLLFEFLENMVIIADNLDDSFESGFTSNTAFVFCLLLATGNWQLATFL
jgi:hypothetical protein